jgi:hypothetical protein
MRNIKERNPELSGRIRLWDISDHGLWVPRSAFKPNQIQFDWGYIAAQCIGKGNSKYKINAMYIEFDNVADEGDPVTIPSYDRGEAIEYYDDLINSGTRDYLRVPLRMSPDISIEPGFENYFAEGEGNLLTFFAQTTGVEGVHGKTFSNGVNSKICGCALVATPVFADRTQDRVFSRTYLAVDDQTVKQVSGQSGIEWQVSFE